MKNLILPFALLCFSFFLTCLHQGKFLFGDDKAVPMNKISKPRANFMVQFLTDANQPSWSKFRTQVRVLGKFPSYQYRWHLPEYVEVDEGEISGTVDVNGPIFIHDLTVSGLVLGDQITFEVFYLDGDAKRGAVANYVIDLDHNSKDAGISIKSVEDKSLRRKIIQ